jgi:DNA-binding winged helix-turn-helix (wHTH) protein
MSVRIILTRTYPPATRSLDPDAIYCSVLNSWLWRGDARVRAGRDARRLFIVLAANAPGIVSRDEAMDALWGDRADGGPDTADTLVKQAFVEARLIAAALGVVVETHGRRGWSARPVKRTPDEGAQR